MNKIPCKKYIFELKKKIFIGFIKLLKKYPLLRRIVVTLSISVSTEGILTLLIMLFTGITLLCFYNYDIHIFFGSSYTATQILTSINQGLLTVFTLVFTVTLVTAQLSSNTFGPKIIPIYLKNIYLWIISLFYLLSVIYITIVVSRIDTIEFDKGTSFCIDLSIIFSLSCLILLIPLIFSFINRLQPKIIANKLIRRIKVSKFKKEGSRIFAPIMECLANAIQKRDVETTTYILDELSSFYSKELSIGVQKYKNEGRLESSFRYLQQLGGIDINTNLNLFRTEFPEKLIEQVSRINNIALEIRDQSILYQTIWALGKIGSITADIAYSGEEYTARCSSGFSLSGQYIYDSINSMLNKGLLDAAFIGIDSLELLANTAVKKHFDSIAITSIINNMIELVTSTMLAVDNRSIITSRVDPAMSIIFRNVIIEGYSYDITFINRLLSSIGQLIYYEQQRFSQQIGMHVASFISMGKELSCAKTIAIQINNIYEMKKEQERSWCYFEEVVISIVKALRNIAVRDMQLNLHSIILDCIYFNLFEIANMIKDIEQYIKTSNSDKITKEILLSYKVIFNKANTDNYDRFYDIPNNTTAIALINIIENKNELVCIAVDEVYDMCMKLISSSKYEFDAPRIAKNLVYVGAFAKKNDCNEILKHCIDKLIEFENQHEKKYPNTKGRALYEAKDSLPSRSDIISTSPLNNILKNNLIKDDIDNFKNEYSRNGNQKSSNGK